MKRGFCGEGDDDDGNNLAADWTASGQKLEAGLWKSTNALNSAKDKIAALGDKVDEAACSRRDTRRKGNDVFTSRVKSQHKCKLKGDLHEQCVWGKTPSDENCSLLSEELATIVENTVLHLCRKPQ